MTWLHVADGTGLLAIRRPLDVDVAPDARERPAADPDGSLVVDGDMDATGAAQRRALARDVRRRRAACPQQPARERRVEAAGHRILDGRAVLRKERPNLECLRRAGRVGA